MRHLFNKLFTFLGVLFLLLILLGFTEQPFWAYYRLGTSSEIKNIHPDKIILMGADGMPSKKNLIRCYYTSEYANKYPQAKVIIALPQSSKGDINSHLAKIVEELVNKGIDSARLEFETEGINTYTQVKNICKNITIEDSILVITSPEHMKRTLMCFYANNITDIEGISSFESDLSPQLLTEKKDSVDMVESLSIRYNIWTQYNYEIIVFREYLAITYYKIKGFI